VSSAPATAPSAARLADALTALSLATDAGNGFPLRLGLPRGVAEGLRDVYERWDGRGIPDGTAGERLSLAARVTHVADQVEIAHRAGGAPSAKAVAHRRAGGHFDPWLADAFAHHADEILAGLDESDMLLAALAAEPEPHACFPRSDLDRLARAFADFADLKSPWMLGHSPAVAELAAAAVGESDRHDVRVAGLLHDLGRASIPNGIWDQPRPLTTAQWDRVRLHPHYTERLLARTAAFSNLAALAAACQERLDATGYHRGLPAAGLTQPSRRSSTGWRRTSHGRRTGAAATTRACRGCCAATAVPTSPSSSPASTRSSSAASSR
jgi:hypothetical protein